MSDRRYLERKEGTYNSSSVKKKDIYNIVDILEEKLTPASTPEKMISVTVPAKKTGADQGSPLRKNYL